MASLTDILSKAWKGLRGANQASTGGMTAMYAPAPQQADPSGQMNFGQQLSPAITALASRMPQQSAPTPAPTLQGLGMDLPTIGAPSFNASLVDPSTGMIDLNQIKDFYKADPNVLARYDQAGQQVAQRGQQAGEEIARQFKFGQEQVATLPAAYDRENQTAQKYMNDTETAVKAALAAQGQQYQGTGGAEALRTSMEANRASRASLVPLLSAGLGERQASQQGALGESMAALQAQVEQGRTAYQETMSQALAQGLTQAESQNAARKAEIAARNAAAQQAAAESAANAKMQQQQFNAQQQGQRQNTLLGLAGQGIDASSGDLGNIAKQAKGISDPGSQLKTAAANYQPRMPKEVSAAMAFKMAQDPGYQSLQSDIMKNPRTATAFNEARAAFQKTAGDMTKLPDIIEKLRKKYPQYDRTLNAALAAAGIQPTLPDLYGAAF